MKDIGPAEIRSGVNPLPVKVPLLLINLDEITDGIGSVLRASQEETVGLRETVFTGGVSTRGRTFGGYCYECWESIG